MTELFPGKTLIDEAEEHLAVLGSLQQAFSRLPSSAVEATAAADLALEEADRDYRRLFEGPEKPLCPPWESAFNSEDDLLFQRETLEVRGFYRRQGLAIDVSGREPEDHIGFEIAFCSHLIAMAKHAHEAGDSARRDEALTELSYFCREHIGAWGPAWSDQLAAKADSAFYQEAAAMLKEELETLDSLLSALAA